MGTNSKEMLGSSVHSLSDLLLEKNGEESTNSLDSRSQDIDNVNICLSVCLVCLSHIVYGV